MKIWSHDQSEPLSDYLNIEDLETLAIADFLDQFQNAPSPRSAFPEAWSDHLFTDPFNAFMRDAPLKLACNEACINQIIQGKSADFGADLVIYPRVGERTHQFSSLNQIRLTPWIKTGIKNFAKAHQICESGLDLIYLRGGSKAWMVGFIADRSPVKAEHSQWNCAEEYLKPIWVVYEHLLTQASEKHPLYVVSNTPQLMEI